MNIVFLEAKNEHDLDSIQSMAYMQIKAYLLRYSKYRTIMDITFSNRYEDIPSNVDIIGISVTSQNFSEAINLGKIIRKYYPKVLLVLGGHHISFLPQTLPEEYDLAVLFEGERTFLEIVESYIDNHKDKDALFKLKGIAFISPGGKVNINSANDLVMPLDRIPFPVNEDSNPPYMLSSRGCPYDCSFCSSTQFWHKYRSFSSDYVISQIEQIANKFPNVKRLGFWDDLFIADKNRFIQIVQQLEKTGLNRKICFDLSVRANLVDEEVCHLLKRMNVVSVGFGAESGSDRILKILKGDSVSVAINQKALDLLYQYQIPTNCSFIVGTPSETYEDLNKTFTFILKNILERKMNPDSVINILMPLPGTKMWKYATNEGIIVEPIDWNRLQIFASYRNSKVASIEEWSQIRLQNNSYYLNESEIPERKLLDYLGAFEKDMKTISELLSDSEILGRLRENKKLSPIGTLDEPCNGQELKGIVAIKGWYINPSGIKDIEVWLNNLCVGTTVYGIFRPDVYNVYPEYLTRHCGYYFRFDTKQVINGVHQLFLKAYTYDNKEITFGNVRVSINN
jgi:anaerobic magnesium-protoporphyrin IX monomethyl ester cyclase